MTTLTTQIDEGTLARAEAKARQRGTTVGALLHEYLDYLAEEEISTCEEAVQSLLSLSKRTHSGSGGRRWTREEVHERWPGQPLSPSGVIQSCTSAEE